jgi:TrmH family RNA methyltransferase
VLTSIHNSQILHLRKLRDKKHRLSYGETLLDGKKTIQVAIQSGVPLKCVYHRAPGTPADTEFLDIIKKKNIECQEISDPVFQKICYGENESGFVARISIPEKSLETLPKTSNPLYVILDCIEKPGNIGAILRTSDAVHVSAVIACDPKTDLYNPNVIRASLGTCFTVPYLQTDTPTLVSFLKQRAIFCFALTPEAPETYLKKNYSGSIAFVVGNEHAGLSSAWSSLEHAALVQKISIPMRGVADSLNVSVALTVVLFEASRQRKH